MGIAIARWILSQQQCLQAIVGGDHQTAIEERHFNMTPDASLVALMERGQNRLRRIHTGEQIDGGDPELQWWLLWLAIERHQTRLTLNHQVIARATRLCAAAVVARDGTINQAWIELL